MQELLDRIGWSQATFARHAGVSALTVNRWCRGRVDPPHLAMRYLELVARLVG